MLENLGVLLDFWYIERCPLKKSSKLLKKFLLCVFIVQTIGDNSAYFTQEFELYLEKSEAKSTDSFINFLLFLNFLSPSHSN